MSARKQAYRVTCSYCLEGFLTIGSGQDIARHGFTVQGQIPGRGLVGCWHTGPCDGFEYAHLGISKRGTEVALSRIESALRMHQATRAKLQARPVLDFTVTEYTRHPATWQKIPGKSQQFDIKPGDPALEYYYATAKWTRRDTYDTVEREAPEVKADRHSLCLPAYDKLLAERLDEVQEVIRRLEAEVKRYTKVIATWAPEKYAPVPVERKVPLVHMRSTHGFGVMCIRRYSVTGPTRSGTTNPAEVTCPRCKARMAVSR